MKLYGYWRSSCSWRVRIALNLKELEYTYVPVHLVKNGGEQHSPSYLAKNPQGQVPTLELASGVSLAQSIAIIEFIEEIKPNPSLFPADRLERARARQMAQIVNAGIQPLQNLSILQHIERLGQDKLDWGQHYIQKGLEDLNTLAIQSSTPFLIGSYPTVADLCLVPQLYNARRFKCNLESVPRLLEIEHNCAQLEAFINAHPDNQPDAQ
ncbi:MAG: maleylacetoacetate isomerase [Proteobacteria bacterium]|nr:maleylacetoacetate isomerase [Pseudomonadota bacterium]